MTNSLQLDRPAAIELTGSPQWPGPVAIAAPVVHSALHRAEIVTELKALRRGRGIFASQIGERVGSGLRELFDVRGDDGPAEIRLKVAQHLRRLAEGLPADLRTATLTAFAIAPDSRQPLYKDRVGMTAVLIQRDPRTARRRIDEAIVQLAQLATAKAPGADPIGTATSSQWRIIELRMSLALDRARPELVEQCRLVAEQDDVAEVDVAAARTLGFTTAAPDELTMDVFYGGILAERRERASVGSHPALLGLGRPLAAGESHEYGVRAVATSSAVLRPQVVYTADRPCDRCELRVRFDRGALPSRVWQVGDAYRALPVDQVGEVHAEFHALLPGHEYGVRWEW